MPKLSLHGLSAYLSPAVVSHTPRRPTKASGDPPMPWVPTATLPKHWVTSHRPSLDWLPLIRLLPLVGPVPHLYKRITDLLVLFSTFDHTERKIQTRKPNGIKNDNTNNKSQLVECLPSTQRAAGSTPIPY